MVEPWTIGLVLVAGLAAFRVWVLLSSDQILAPVRDRLPLRVVEFLTCPWCAGFWVAAAVFGVIEVWGDGAWVQAGVAVLALSAVVALAAAVTAAKGDE
jgi:hypothetical protein